MDAKCISKYVADCYGTSSIFMVFGYRNISRHKYKKKKKI